MLKYIWLVEPLKQAVFLERVFLEGSQVFIDLISPQAAAALNPREYRGSTVYKI